jgi:hypothetical protein
MHGWLKGIGGGLVFRIIAEPNKSAHLFCLHVARKGGIYREFEVFYLGSVRRRSFSARLTKTGPSSSPTIDFAGLTVVGDSPTTPFSARMTSL